MTFLKIFSLVLNLPSSKDNLRARVGITFLSLLGLLNHTFVVPPQFSGAKSSSSRLDLIQNPRRKERKVIPIRALTRHKTSNFDEAIVF
jgi:hypothetical protein